ncbi:MAG: prolipoprotein diacylglyceryl transferase [Oscillospiraceae bacterium]|nr:prolipoprotein diacylglyceryl transferase [Oscillospiraceae bacterium]
MSDALISFPLLGDGFVLDIPRYFTVFGFRLYWYGVIIALGFILGVLYALKVRKRFGLAEEDIIDFVLWGVPLAIIGARLYHVVFNLGDYRDNPIDIIKIWEGGSGIFGALLFVIITIIAVSKVKKIKAGALFDISALGLLIGQSVGRWGNFVNRELYGIATDLPWRMGLTTQSETIYVHPLFLYESLWNALGFVILHFMSKKRKYDGEIFVCYLAWYCFGRCLCESIRATHVYYVNFFGHTVSASMIVSAAVLILSLAFLIINKVAVKHDASELYALKGRGEQKSGAKN